MNSETGEPRNDKLLTLCLFFSNGHWDLQKLNYKIKSKIVPITGKRVLKLFLKNTKFSCSALRRFQNLPRNAAPAHFVELAK